MTAKKQTPLEYLRNLLESNRFPPQSKLPTERELSEELNVSRSELRKALLVLESENKIWRKVGKGTFTGPPPNSNITSLNASALEAPTLALFTEKTNPTEVMEVRLILEPSIAFMSALRSTPEDHSVMLDCHRKAGPTALPDEFEKWDTKLHWHIAQSTRNSLLISLFNLVNNLREDRIWGLLKAKTMSPEHQKTYEKFHGDLVDSIINRDATAAREIMHAHLEMVQKNMLRSFSSFH